VFSLKSLLLSVLVAAVFIVAFLNASPILASVIVTLTVALLVCALVSIYLFPERRPFFVCAVVAGVTYAALAFVRPLGLHDSLITTRILFEWWCEDSQQAITDFASSLGVSGSDKVNMYNLLTAEFISLRSQLPEVEGGRLWSILRIGHCAVALILAVIAGLVVSAVARRREVRSTS
jgi:hypothetical protein